MAVCQNLVPLVNIKIAGKWMLIPLKMVLIGIDPYPYLIGGLEDVFHSVGTFMIPTGPKSIIFQRGRAQPPTNQIIL